MRSVMAALRAGEELMFDASRGGVKLRSAPAPHFPEGLRMASASTTAFDFQASTIGGQPVSLADHRGKVLLVVNTASACGFTPQFEGLEKLWQAHRDKGLVVVGFPSNQFGHQDPGSNDEIASFCSVNYGVSFPMMAKVDVNGADAHPLWKWLTAEAP